MFIWQIFLPPNGAINYYFDSAIGNSILSVHYQTEGVAESWGDCVNLLCNLQCRLKYLYISHLQYIR